MTIKEEEEDEEEEEAGESEAVYWKLITQWEMEITETDSDGFNQHISTI